jgi:hypothetical protein
MTARFEFQIGLTYLIVADTTLHVARIRCVDVCPRDSNSVTEAALFEVLERLPAESFAVPYLLLSRNVDNDPSSCGMAYKLRQNCSWEDATEWDRGALDEDGDLAQFKSQFGPEPTTSCQGRHGCLGLVTLLMQLWVNREQRKQ